LFDLIVAGAGPAGLLAALSAASGGLSVCLIEKNSCPGRKLLITGSGRCNVTHTGSLDGFLTHFGKKKNFIRPCLYHFSNTDVLTFFNSRRCSVRDRGDGKVFPVSENSHDILNVLVKECETNGVHIHCGSGISEVEKTGNIFTVRIDNGRKFEASNLLLSSGGMSYPGTGSTGDGYTLAKSLGHSIVPPAPALSPVLIKEFKLADCSGISLYAAVSLYREGLKQNEFADDLLITHKGFSGPVILNNSRDMTPRDTLFVSFFPSYNRNEFQKALLSEAGLHGKRSVFKSDVLKSLPERLRRVLFDHAGLHSETMAHLEKKQRNSLLSSFLEYPALIQSKGGFNTAMVTSGGINLKEVDAKTMASRICPGLSFAGEILDVDGDTGGYNLQFAFSSAKLAADRIITDKN